MLKKTETARKQADQKKEGFLRYVYIVFAVCVAFFLVYISMTIKSPTEQGQDVVPIHITGQYTEISPDKVLLDEDLALKDVLIGQDAQWRDYSNSDSITSTIDSVLLRGYVQDEIPKGAYIMLYLYRVNVHVIINGQEYFHSDAAADTRWDSFVSPGISSDDEIMILLNQNGNKSYAGAYELLLEQLCSGSVYGLLKQQLRKNFYQIFFSVVTCIMGIAILVAMCSLRFLGVSQIKGYLSCGLLLIAGSMGTFIDYEYVTLMVDNAVLITAIDFVTQLLICTFLMMYLKNYLRTEKYRRITDVTMTLWLICIVVYFVLRIVGLADEENMINSMFVEVITLFGIEIVFLLMDFKKYKDRMTKNVLISSAVLLAVTLAEIIHYFITNVFWFYVFQVGLIVFTIAQFGVLLSYTKGQIIRARRLKEVEADILKKDAQLQKANVSIMLSQIQPHFLYNALSSITSLCDEDPQIAKWATVEFANFLRGNMDSLSADKPIWFEKELDHTKRYLSLEQLRFPDKLHVEYDLQVMDFRVPTLTLQPLVENAVRYGVTKCRNGGTVFIGTQETEDAYIIRIEDNGVGYDLSETKEDGRSHIGISNVRNRIAQMCNGSLVVESTIGEGTKVRVTIPK